MIGNAVPCTLQLTCRSCSDLNCADGACTDGFGCSACPAGFGIASSEPPFACIVRCPPYCVDCDDVRGGGVRSDDGRCNACAQVGGMCQRVLISLIFLHISSMVVLPS